MSRPHPLSRSHTYSEASSGSFSTRSSDSHRSTSTSSRRSTLARVPSTPSRELVRYASSPKPPAAAPPHRSSSSSSGTSSGLRPQQHHSNSARRAVVGHRRTSSPPPLRRRATDTLLDSGNPTIYNIKNNSGTVNISTGGAYVDLAKKQYVSYRDCGNSYSHVDRSRREYYKEKQAAAVVTGQVAEGRSGSGRREEMGLLQLMEKGARIVQPFLR